MSRGFSQGDRVRSKATERAATIQNVYDGYVRVLWDDEGVPEYVGNERIERIEYDETPTVHNARSELLRLAESHVNGDRNSQYGDPNQDFARTAAMWSAYLGIEVKPHDVAAMMCLLKVSRIRWSPSKQDSWTDLAGYAACGWDCAKDTTSGTSPPTQPQREPPPDKMQRGV